MPSKSLRWLIDFLIRRRVTLFVSACALTALMFVPALRLQFDESIESFYAEDNPRLMDYKASRDVFQGDEFVMVAYADPELLTPAGQDRLAQLADKLGEVPGVYPDSVQSLNRMLMATKIPIFAHLKPKLLKFCQGILLGENDQTTAVIVRLMGEATAPVRRGETIAAIRQIAADRPVPTYVVGEPVLLHDMFKYAHDDGEKMGWAASVLLIVVILFFLRSLRWVILPFVVVQMTIVWTKAWLVLANLQLSMVSSILTSLVTIIGVSTVVYMALYYRKLCERLDRISAFRETLDVLSVDVFWVCATTAAGFATQLSSHIYPVRIFGLMMTVGSMVVLLAMAMVLPAGTLFGKEKFVPPPANTEERVDRSFLYLSDWAARHPWVLGAISLVLLGLGVSGLFMLKIETDFSKNFRATSPVVKSLDFVETHLGGAGTWEVNFPAPEELTQEYLDSVRHLTDKLREIQVDNDRPLTKVVAVTDGLDLVPKVPFLTSNLSGKLRVLNMMEPEFLPSLYNPKAGRMRIMLRARERQPAEEKGHLIASVERVSREHFPEAKTTGLFVMLSFLIESLLADQWTSFALGAIGLVSMMTLAYRSLWYGFIALIPNLLPIILVMGAMGWIGLRVNIGTAMISSDTMGLTIHDSIFYLSAFRRAQHGGLGFASALHRTQTEIGRPLIYSNIALILGFLVLTLSHFIPLVYFGLLVSISITGGLAGNILLLPVLLRIGTKKPAEPPEL